MAKILLFVYGTLKRGFPQNRLLADQEFIGEVQTLPHYRLLTNGSYPCLVPEPGQGVAVHGELWLVEESPLARIDEYESVPLTFLPQEIEISGHSTHAWAFF